MTPEADIRERAARIREDRAALPALVRKARSDGASVAQLMEWTGYSRRQVFYLLKDDTKGTK